MLRANKIIYFLTIIKKLKSVLKHLLKTVSIKKKKKKKLWLRNKDKGAKLDVENICDLIDK